jgi:Tol biopolymer transport system component
MPQLFKIPLAGGAAVRLVADYAVDPAWSPSGRFLVFSGADVGTDFSVRAVHADGTPYDIQPLVLSRGSRRLDFLGEHLLVMLKGDLSYKELWVVDVVSGEQRQLTALGPGPLIDEFDVSADGTQIVLTRASEESDIVLIDLREP